MKTVVLAINSKFVHTLLAPRYLIANTSGDVSIYETNINTPIMCVLGDIYNLNPDVIAISTYIFNIAYVDNLLLEIRKILPYAKIVLGGWEVSFNVEKYLHLADYILKGEGDFAFAKLLADIENGVVNDKVIECGIIDNLDDIKSPYTADYVNCGKNKIIYMETTRGCPFSCGYCMSGNTGRVRSFSIDRVYSDIKKVMSVSPKQVKFVDRTFNYDKKRAAEILKHIIENYSHADTNFHFEMAPELFDDNIFDTLKSAKKGLFRFEIGVQSYNKETLDAVSRKSKNNVVDKNISRLVEMGNVIIHVDLIAGLPKEDINSFISGFNRLIRLKPHNLQLGFLKVLKGSAIATGNFGYKITSTPPYEILSGDDLSFGDIIRLKKAEETLEVFYNSGKFNKSINYLLDNAENPFALFEDIYCQITNKGLPVSALSSNHKCDNILEFGSKFFSGNIEKLSILEKYIEEDFEACGNCRKWHKVPYIKH